MKNVTNDIRLNKGGTYVVSLGANGVKVEKAYLRDGYMVALDGYECIVNEAVLDDFTIGTFIGKRWDILQEANHFVGAWETNGRVYLDVSRRVEGFDSAVQVGINHHQKAIWDIAKGEEISLDGMGWHF